MQLKREVENKDNPLKDNIWLRLTEENLTKAGKKLWEYICSKKMLFVSNTITAAPAYKKQGSVLGRAA